MTACVVACVLLLRCCVAVGVSCGCALALSTLTWLRCCGGGCSHLPLKLTCSYNPHKCSASSWFRHDVVSMSESLPVGSPRPVVAAAAPAPATEDESAASHSQDDQLYNQLCHHIYRHLLSSVCLDLSIRAHRRHHTQQWTTGPATQSNGTTTTAAASTSTAPASSTLSTSTSTGDLSVKKSRKDLSLQSLRCLHCGRSTASTLR